jgi:flagellar hook-associated protein 3 FlgL
MTLRIATATLHRQGVENMLRQQALLAQTQNQIASGQRLQSAAANPVEWARATRLDETLASLQRYQDNAATAADRLGFEDSALANAGDVLFRVRELALQANSAALDADSRRIVAAELRGLREQLLDIANSRDGEGRYLFAGSRSASAPFAFSASGITYNGDNQSRLLALSAHRQIADGDTGADVFMNLRSGNGTFAVTALASNGGQAFITAASLIDPAQWDGGSYALSFSAGNYEIRDTGGALVGAGAYSEGQSIQFRGIQLTLTGAPADGDQFRVDAAATQDLFVTLQQVIDFAQSPGASASERALQQTRYFGALQQLDSAQSHLSNLRGSVGARLSAIDDAGTALGAQSLLAEQHLAELRDLDYAEAASRLALQQTLLQAAQLSYQRVQGLSLFDYLR